MTATIAVPKHIKVIHNRTIRLRLPQQLVWMLAAAFVGAYIISALYYLITQVDWSIGGHHLFYLKHGWDHWFDHGGEPWHSYRHWYRDVYEGLLATPLAKSLMASWKKHPYEKLRGWAISERIVLLIVSSFVLVSLGIYALYHLPMHLQSNYAIVGSFNWQPFLIGVIAGQILHAMYRPLGNMVQLYFIERSLNKAKMAASRIYHMPFWVRHPVAPPVLRERWVWTQMDGGWDRSTKAGLSKFVIPASVFVGFVLFGVGCYVRFVVAKSG